MEGRTYKQQIEDAIKEGAKEIMFVVSTPKEDFSKIDDFIVSICNKCSELKFKGDIVIAGPNEPLEHISTSKMIELYNFMSDVVAPMKNVYLAIGGMASEFTTYFDRITKEVERYDFVEFHTSNDGNLWSIDWLLKYLPPETKFINSEHYLWNCGAEHGYDSKQCVEKMKAVTDYLFSQERIRSVYVCMPSAYVKGFKYKHITLQYVDKSNKVSHITKVWYLLKLYEKGEEIVAKLRELEKGAKGPDVACVQDTLNALDIKTGPVDGIFGSKTEKAVKEYQKKKGLKETGVFDFICWYMLATEEKYPMGVETLFEMLKVMD